MNTKIAFYLTGFSGRDIIKNVYECITDNDIYDTSDAQDFIDTQLTKILDDSNISICFDCVILYVKKTTIKKPSISLIKTVYGVLSFPVRRKQRNVKSKANNNIIPDEQDSIDYLQKQIDALTALKLESKTIELETVKIKLEIAKIQNENLTKELNKSKDYRSCYIKPNGEIIYVGFAQHESWASEYLQEREGDDWMDFKDGNYSYVILENEGWVRILGWTDPPTFSLPEHITPKQKRSIKEYCQTEGCDLPYELKN